LTSLKVFYDSYYTVNTVNAEYGGRFYQSSYFISETMDRVSVKFLMMGLHTLF